MHRLYPHFGVVVKVKKTGEDTLKQEYWYACGWSW